VPDRDSGGPSIAGLVLVDGVPVAAPGAAGVRGDAGWLAQPDAGPHLAAATVRSRLNQVRAFADHSGAFPWEWSAQLADEWFADMRAIRHCSRSTVRGYQVSVRGFCAYLTDPAYG
jgi:hypothetical protein